MARPVHVFDAARYICERGGWKVTNLQLQKILYMAQLKYMGEHGGERLVDETFEAWDYGPVSPTLYRQVRSFGSGPVKNVFHSASRIDDPEMRAALEHTCDVLLKKTPGQLVSITHWENGAWYRNYRPDRQHIPIPDGHILDEFAERVRSAAARRIPA